MASICRNLLTIFFCLHFGGGFLVIFQGLAWIEMAQSLEQQGITAEGQGGTKLGEVLYKVVFSEPSCSRCHAVQEEAAKHNLPLSSEESAKTHTVASIKLQLCSPDRLLYRPMAWRLPYCLMSWRCPFSLKESPELPPPNAFI